MLITYVLRFCENIMCLPSRWGLWPGTPARQQSFTLWRQRAAVVATKCSSAPMRPLLSLLSSCVARSTSCQSRQWTPCAQANQVSHQGLCQVGFYSRFFYGFELISFLLSFPLSPVCFYLKSIFVIPKNSEAEKEKLYFSPCWGHLHSSMYFTPNYINKNVM